MASIYKIEFTVDGEDKAEVLNLNYSLEQNVDRSGQVAGEASAFQIKTKVRTVGSTGHFDWMKTPDMKKNGKFEYFDSAGQILKTLEFEDAYCIRYEENFDAFDTNQRGASPSFKEGGTEELIISPRKVNVGGVPHENYKA